jgi:hypothetical protein
MGRVSDETRDFEQVVKPALTDKLEAVSQERSFTGNAPGGPSRWSTKRSAE